MVLAFGVCKCSLLSPFHLDKHAQGKHRWTAKRRYCVGTEQLCTLGVFQSSANTERKTSGDSFFFSFFFKFQSSWHRRPMLLKQRECINDAEWKSSAVQVDFIFIYSFIHSIPVFLSGQKYIQHNVFVNSSYCSVRHHGGFQFRCCSPFFFFISFIFRTNVIAPPINITLQLETWLTLFCNSRCPVEATRHLGVSLQTFRSR